MSRFHRAFTLSGIVFFLLTCLLGVPPAEGRGGWPDPPYVYCYEAKSGEDAYNAAFNTLGNLDGTWRRSSNSDQWDGSTPEPGDGCPGGAAVELLPGEGEGGGDASVLSLEDVGDPRGGGTGPCPNEPSNRKIFLWRDTSSELNLVDGITLVARWRLNPAPRSLEFSNNGGALPVPNGTHLHDQNKGQIAFVQKTAANGGAVAATLAFAITDAGDLQFIDPFNNTPCAGIYYPGEKCFDIDELAWVTVWLAAQEDNVSGALKVKIFFNGDAAAAFDEELFGVRADAETAARPEGGGNASSYINMALGSTGQDGAIQVDYLCIAQGFLEPEGFNPACPGGLQVQGSGRNVVLSWKNGTTVPSGVNVTRNGVAIAAGAPAGAESFTDGSAVPGILSYRLDFTVPGANCDPLAGELDACPKGMTASQRTAGVRLEWQNTIDHDGFTLSRDGAVIEGNLAGNSTGYLDATAAPGAHTYSLVPATGNCQAIETSIRVFKVPPATGDFSAAAAFWAYILDPPVNADPGQYLLHNPVAGEFGDLDGNWSSGNGSDSWDGSAPGEIGDPILDPLSASPGGIGLVNDGSAGAYLFEDTGDPTQQGWQDPSNRKIYLGYDLSASIADVLARSLINDGFTFRARFRLTPPGQAVDVPDAPNGYRTNNNGKGMFSIVHDAGRTGVAANQRVGIALDVNPDEPGAGILMIGEGANFIQLPIADPTQWLDLWIALEDKDPLTPEISLNLYLNGLEEPTVSLDDFIPNDGGLEGTFNAVSGNAIFMGLNSTPEVGSMEVDLISFLDGVLIPGQQPGGRQKPGDCNGDGVADITDAICMLTHLFTGDQETLPCGGSDVNAGGNLALINFNGDQSGVDITDAINLLTRLFLGGVPHVLGEVCRPFADCPNNPICPR